MKSFTILNFSSIKSDSSIVPKRTLLSLSQDKTCFQNSGDILHEKSKCSTDSATSWQKVQLGDSTRPICPRAYFSKALLEGLFYRGKFAFPINWASLIVGSKFTVFDLFYFVFECNFPSTSSWEDGDYIWRGNLVEDFLRYYFGRLTFGGAYKWRGIIFRILWYMSERCMLCAFMFNRIYNKIRDRDWFSKRLFVT